MRVYHRNARFNFPTVHHLVIVVTAIIVHWIHEFADLPLRKQRSDTEQLITSHPSWNCGVLAPRPIEHSNIVEVWPRAVCSAAPENRNMCKNASSFRQNCFIKPILRRKYRLLRWQGGRSNDFIHAFASLAQTVLRMGGFYHSVLTAHQLLKGIQSNIQKNGGGKG